MILYLRYLFTVCFLGRGSCSFVAVNVIIYFFFRAVKARKREVVFPPLVKRRISLGVVFEDQRYLLHTRGEGHYYT